MRIPSITICELPSESSQVGIGLQKHHYIVQKERIILKKE